MRSGLRKESNVVPRGLKDNVALEVKLDAKCAEGAPERTIFPCPAAVCPPAHSAGPTRMARACRPGSSARNFALNMRRQSPGIRTTASMGAARFSRSARSPTIPSLPVVAACRALPSARCVTSDTTAVRGKETYGAASPGAFKDSRSETEDSSRIDGKPDVLVSGTDCRSESFRVGAGMGRPVERRVGLAYPPGAKRGSAGKRRRASRRNWISP